MLLHLATHASVPADPRKTSGTVVLGKLLNFSELRAPVLYIEYNKTVTVKIKCENYVKDKTQSMRGT